nr:FecR domain-containing protein [Calditrichia bacterium]
MQARLWPWLICLLLAGSALAQDSTAATQTRITFPLNRVFVTKAMGNGMDYARFNMNVAPGDQIHTKKLSRCELTLPGGSALRMDEKSDLIVGAPTEGQEPFLLNDGRLWVSMTPGDIRTFGILFGGSVYEFEGNGAAFRVERQADSLKVVLYRGYLAVGKKGGDSQLLTAGEKPMVAAPQIVNAAFVMQAPAEETAVEEGMADDSTAGDSTAMA